jgi:hypothetical protein
MEPMTTVLESGQIEEMGARRRLIIGGIVLIIAGMIFGDVFAVFVLHQNGNRIGEALMAVTDAVAAKDPAAVAVHFTRIGGLLENRGTKVDTHVHMIDFGYLALLLALIQPYVALAGRARKRLAALFLMGAVMLPISVFAIHYVGLKYSPLRAIGWASIFADLGGLLVIIACSGELIGLLEHIRGQRDKAAEDPLPNDGGWSSRVLLAGGTLLILAGFLHGAFYAVFDVQTYESQDQVALETMINASVAQQNSASRNMRDAHSVVEGYGMIQAEKAVNIAAHSHIIEFGLLAILLAFIQPFVGLAERWKRRWVVVMLTGSVVLPVFVLLELKFGLVAGGIADVGGLLVIVALVGMLCGGLRYTRQADAESRPERLGGSSRLLVISGVALAIWGMNFGLYYALFAEHQALDKMGGSLAAAFSDGAKGDLIATHDSLQAYADAQFNYVRSVDVHSHWIGLAMLLIVLGIAFDRGGFTGGRQKLLACLLVIGSVAFPLGVHLQTLDRGIIPQAVAAVGAGLVIIALAAVALSFARSERNR